MKKRRIFPLVIILFLVFVSNLIFKYFNQDKTLISPYLPKPPLQQIVEKALEKSKGTYAIVFKNMKTGESFQQKADMVFEPGSLYKLWLMGAVFEKLEKSEIDEEEILSQDIAVLNREFEISEEVAEFKEGRVTLSVKNALHQMITISHNYAALLLLEKIKTSNLKAWLKDNGFTHSDTGAPPKTTASDIALFLEKLYKRELINPEYSGKMIELLKEQKLVDGLPKYLPKGVQIANKTGDIGWFKHDAGIVFTNLGDYIIVVLSQSDSPSGAQEIIAQISKAVYGFITQP